MGEALTSPESSGGGVFLAHLGPSWALLGPILAHSGPSRRQLGSSWRRLGFILGHFGPSHGHLEPSWAHPSGTLSISRSSLHPKEFNTS